VSGIQISSKLVCARTNRLRKFGYNIRKIVEFSVFVENVCSWTPEGVIKFLNIKDRTHDVPHSEETVTQNLNSAEQGGFEIQNDQHHQGKEDSHCSAECILKKGERKIVTALRTLAFQLLEAGYLPFMFKARTYCGHVSKPTSCSQIQAQNKLGLHTAFKRKSHCMGNTSGWFKDTLSAGPSSPSVFQSFAEFA
jgi:hypothetical protein